MKYNTIDEMLIKHLDSDSIVKELKKVHKNKRNKGEIQPLNIKIC